MSTDCLIDGNSLFARSWYAAQKMGPDPTQTLKLAAISMLSILNPLTSPIGTTFSRTLFCWDAPAGESKHREPRPPEYYEMRLIAKDLFALLLGAENVEIDPFEGDDLVASAVYTSDPQHDVVVVSGDKDLMQLADGKRVVYYSLNEKCALSVPFICNKFHIKHPSQIALALAIQGDAVDCIPGVRGWGKEKVRKLFKTVSKDMTFNEVIGILENYMNAEQRKQFYASLKRTIPETSLPVPPPAPILFPDDADVAALDMPDVAKRLRELKFAYEQNNFSDYP